MEEKRAGGRPTKYKKGFARKAEKLCNLGATDEEIADFFGVHVVTIYRWKNKHPEFCNALKVGKGRADDRVERSLYQRALGYSHPEDKIFASAGEPLIVPTVKHYPPDTTAAIFWLKNRRAAEWRDTQYIAPTDDAPPMTVNVSVSPAKGDVRVTNGPDGQ